MWRFPLILHIVFLLYQCSLRHKILYFKIWSIFFIVFTLGILTKVFSPYKVCSLFFFCSTQNLKQSPGKRNRTQSISKWNPVHWTSNNLEHHHAYLKTNKKTHICGLFFWRIPEMLKEDKFWEENYGNKRELHFILFILHVYCDFLPSITITYLKVMFKSTLKLINRKNIVG